MNNLCPCCGKHKKHSLEKSPSLWSKTCGDKQCIKVLTQKTNLETYGHVSNLHMKLDNGKTVLKNSIESKYRVQNVSQIPEVKRKKQETCYKNFGVFWPMQSEAVRAKSVKTLTEKYGFDNASKHPDVKPKIKETQIQKYGDFYVKTEEYKELITASNREKYGVDYYFSSKEFKDRLEKRCLELFGVTNPFFSSYVQAQIAKRNGKGKSLEETKWLDDMKVLTEFRQHPIKGASGKTYVVDGFDPITNTIYEYNGSFWHGNPDYYDRDTAHPVIKSITFGELYDKTIQKQLDILGAGYNMVVEWSKI